MAPITIIPKACSCCKGERSSRDKSSNLPLPNILYEGSKGSEGKVLKMDRPAAGGFLSLTAFQAEGCGGGFAADLKKRGAAGAAGWAEGLCSLRSGGWEKDP